MAATCQGIRVPDGLAVIGMDGILEDAYSHPRSPPSPKTWRAWPSKPSIWHRTPPTKRSPGL